MKNMSEKEVWIVFAIGGTFILGLLFLVALWTDRTLDFWLTYFKGASTDCPFWLSCLVTLFLNAVIFGVNVISEIARLLV